ncbi:MAG: S-layer homology domain-containing protein [Clostridia bacterium]|nr:S-layer homology domain-containing protein [Clostridia bacterium]
MKHKTRNRICGLILAWLFLISIIPAELFSVSAVSADTKEDYGLRLTLQESGDKAVLSVELRGPDLARTQCIALAYDPAVLALPGEAEKGETDPPLRPMSDCSAMTFPTGGWTFSSLLPETGRSLSGDTAYLILYPACTSGAAYKDYTAVMQVAFDRPAGTVLSAGSLRLLSYAEQKALNQSVKYAVCSRSGHYTYGALTGGDTLKDAVFAGNTSVTGEMPAETIKPEVPWVNPFRDVSDADPYYNDIAYVCREGLFVGTSASTFAPLASMTRATFATVLCRLSGNEPFALAAPGQKETLSAFSDINKDGWYVPYVAWALETGLFKGYGNGCFGPDDNITHEQMYVLMQRYCEGHGYAAKPAGNTSLASLADAAKVSSWAEDGVKFAFANGLLIVDSARTVRPGENAARRELAALLHQLSSIRHEEPDLRIAETELAQFESSALDAERFGDVYRKIYEGLATLSPSISLSAYRITAAELDSVFEQAAKQPEFFYLAASYNYSYSGTTGIVSALMPTYTMRGAELIAAQKAYSDGIDRILSGVSPAWSDFEKVLYIHDYLAKHFRYDESLDIADVYRFFKTGSGVCQAYTLTCQALLDALGIENDRAVSREMNHMWNLVRVNGKWYHMDITWDDPLPDQMGMVFHTYFLRSDEYMGRHRHSGWAAEHICDAADYDSAPWTETRSPIVPLAGKWYYIDNASGDLCTLDPGSGKVTARKPLITTRWTTSAGTYPSTYSGLTVCGDVLIYNSSSAVLAYHPQTGISETLYSYKDKGLICGSYIAPDGYNAANETCTVRYIVRSSPSDKTGKEYKLTVSLKTSFTFTLTGSMSGYFADSPITVRISKNGAAVKTIEIPRAKSYLRENVSFRMEGVRTGVYDLTVECAGCYPCTVTGLTVYSDTDIGAWLAGIALIRGDLNGDSVIDHLDERLMISGSTWHNSAAGAAVPAADLNGDGRIDFVDYAILTVPGVFRSRAADCITPFLPAVQS